MPHIDVSMLPGRSEETKKALAIKLQALLAGELELDPKYVSVSVRDVERSDWADVLRKIPSSTMMIPPAGK